MQITYLISSYGSSSATDSVWTDYMKISDYFLVFSENSEFGILHK